MNRRRLRAASLFGLLWLASGAASAMGLQVAPISLTIPPSQPAQGLWLSNTSGSELQAQLRVFRWTQSGFEGMQLTPARGLVISPPIAVIPPDERQLVRVIRTGPPPVGKNATESAYRVIINELPEPRSKQGAGLNFIMKYSVPVFVAPAADGEQLVPELHWRLRLEGGQAILIGTNSGRKHAQLSQVSFITPGGEKILLEDGLFGYILPHATRKWTLDPKAALFAGGGRLRARVNEHFRTQSVEVASPRR